VKTELRPLDLGEILDRTFQIYRTHFLLFAGLASVGAACNLVWTTIHTFTVRTLTSHGTALQLQIVNLVFQCIAVGVVIMAFSVVWAAMVHTVAAIYLEQQTGVGRALRTVLPRWFRLVLVTLTSFLVPWFPVIAGVGAIAVAGVMMRGTAGGSNTVLIVTGIVGFSFLIFIPVGIWLSLRYALANASCAFEGTKLRQSLKRSVFLGKGLRWRLFAVLLVAGVLQLIVGLAVSIPVWVTLARNALHPPLWAVIYTLLSSFAASVLTTPIAGIGVALFYFDTRIRKEGLDIEWSLQPVLQPDGGATPPALSQPDPSAG
jgi:hypothetical protein